MILKEKTINELFLKTSSLLNASWLGYRGEFQLVQVVIEPKTNKEDKLAFHNVGNLFCNRSVEHYGLVKLLSDERELTYFFLIANDEEAMDALKATLQNGQRKTFQSAEIVLQDGKESLVVNDASSLLKSQTLIVSALENRMKQEGRDSYSISGRKLPLISIRKVKKAA